MNQPIKEYKTTSQLVDSSKVNPSTETKTPIVRTAGSDIAPVTVGLVLVRFMTESISASYQLFKKRAPATTAVLPIMTRTN